MNPLDLLGPEVGLPLDIRLLAAVVALLVAGFAKGVAGLGVPIIATPIIALLYDLKSAIVIVTLPMLLADLPFVIGGRRYVREAGPVIPFILTAIVGILIGTQLLVRLDERILSGALGFMVLIFVTSSWFNVLPSLEPRLARIAGPPVGLIAGLFSGSAGAAGPLVTMYLLVLGIPRQIFVFVINAIFQVMDTTLFLSLVRLGLYTPGLSALALLAILPVGLGFWLGALAHNRIDDKLFRRIVLVILVLSATNLFFKALSPP
jgi:uncharacterized membrane protein YfcA